MAVSRVQFLFADGAGYGWSESYYLQLNGSQDIYTPAVELANARVQMLPSDAQFNYIRYSTGVVRDVGFIQFNPSAGYPNGQFPGNSSPDFNAIKVRLESSAAGNGRIFMRTVPLAAIGADFVVISPAFLAAFNAWANILITTRPGGQQWNVKTSLGAPKTRYQCTSLVPLNPRGYVFTTTNDFLDIGEVIRMSQASVYGYNGQKTIVDVGAAGPPYTIQVGGATPPTSEPTSSATFYTVQPTNYNSIITCINEGLTRRNPGNFFGRRRGRRSTQLPLRR